MNDVISRTCFLLLLLGLASCADLKGINKFTLSSAKVLERPFPYSYHEYCYDSCYIFDTAAARMTYPCDCSTADRYDTAVIRESGKLVNYFIALSRLSGSSDIINIDTLAGAVQAGQYGSLKVSSTDAQVASAVATAIQDLVTAGFKSRHLADNLNKYNTAVDSSLFAYCKHLDNLRSLDTNLIIDLGSALDAYRRKAPQGPERWAILYAYNEKLRQLSASQREFGRLIQQIRLIRAGYQQLALNTAGIRSKDLRRKLMALVQNISYLSDSKN